jgi:hypothetical protein
MGHRVVWYVGINVPVECAFICFANEGSNALRNVGTAVHTDIQQDCNINNFVVYEYTVSQQMHYSDSLLISYSSYMFRRMYVIIREPSFTCPAEFLST